MESDTVKLKINILNNDNWILTLNRNYAERLMKEFHYKTFKRGTLQIGRFNRGEKVQIFNIKYITSMSITEENTK